MESESESKSIFSGRSGSRNLSRLKFFDFTAPTTTWTRKDAAVDVLRSPPASVPLDFFVLLLSWKTFRPKTTKALKDAAFIVRGHPSSQMGGRVIIDPPKYRLPTVTDAKGREKGHLFETL